MDEKFYRDKYKSDIYGNGRSDVNLLVKLLRRHSLLHGGGNRGNLRVLDVGCGRGDFCGQLLLHCGGHADITGIDLVDQPQFVGHFIRQSIIDEPLKVDSNAFDLVFSSHVLEHIFDTEKLIRECYRVCRPGAAFVLSVPNMGYWGNRLLTLFGYQPLMSDVGVESVCYGVPSLLKKRHRHFLPSGHIRSFSPAALKDLAESAGFKTVCFWKAGFDLVGKVNPKLGINLGIILQK